MTFVKKNYYILEKKIFLAVLATLIPNVICNKFLITARKPWHSPWIWTSGDDEYRALERYTKQIHLHTDHSLYGLGSRSTRLNSMTTQPPIPSMV